MNFRFPISSLLVFISVLLVVFLPFPSYQGRTEEHNINIEASMFDFTPASFKVNPGDKVTISLTSIDVVHGLYLDGYNLNLTSDPGQTSELSFTANQRGSFRFRCSVTCGSLHPFMIGRLQVGTNPLLWRGIGLSIIAVLGVMFRSKA